MCSLYVSISVQMYMCVEDTFAYKSCCSSFLLFRSLWKEKLKRQLKHHRATLVSDTVLAMKRKFASKKKPEEHNMNTADNANTDSTTPSPCKRRLVSAINYFYQNLLNFYVFWGTYSHGYLCRTCNHRIFY